MSEPTLYRRNFRLHLQKRPSHDGPVLLKEPAREPASPSHIDQLHNEYAVTRQLADVAGVRPALAKEGSESRPVAVLEYIQGQSLAEVIRSASLDVGEKLRLAVDTARVLGRVHDREVMHKDVSSGNLLVAAGDSAGSQGGVYLIDFGLASVVRQESPSRLAADDSLRTYSELLARSRLTLARRLLLDRSNRVIDVAFEAGYSDPAHFTKAFRRWTGSTPNVYRAAQLTAAAQV